MNRADIEAFCDKPNAALTDTSKREFLQLCDLALRGLEAGEPVATIQGCDPDDEREGARFSLEDLMRLDKLPKGTKLYASAPSGMVAEDYKARYYDLLMSVGNKYPDETRHETAKRYILNAERWSNTAGQAAPEVKP